MEGNVDTRETGRMRETRRIQKTGGSTYVVSLPKKWITDAGLGKGDQVVLSYSGDGSLSVSPDVQTETEKLSKQVEVSQDTDPKALLRQLIGAYVTGFDIIEVRAKNRIPAELRKTVQDFSRRVIGPEIVEESSTLIVLQDVADHADLAMKKVVHRMHLMARSMLADSIESVRRLDKEQASELIARDDEIDRLYWFVEKQHAMIGRNIAFASKMKTTWLEADVLLSAAKALERIADHATRIAHSVALLSGSKMDADTIDSITRLSEKAVAVLDCSIESLFRKDPILANKCIEQASDLRERTNVFLREVVKRKGNIAVGLAFAAESIERTGGYSSDIAETAINLSEGQ